MISQKRLCFGLLLVISLVFGVCLPRANAQAKPALSTSHSIQPFLGRWDLTIKTPGLERPSWLELSERGGEIEGLMVGFWAHATPPSKIQIKDGEIEFLPPHDVGYDDSTVFKGKLAGGQLEGTVTSPKGVVWQWTGRRAPALARKSAAKWGKPIRLFNGKNLAGWRFLDPSRAKIWSVENGTLVKNGNGSELVTTATNFEDFKLHVEFNCGVMANSGVYLRGRYEVQIETDSAGESPNRQMGSIYGFLAPEPPLARTPNVWQTYDITLIGRTLTVVHDGLTAINHREIPGITGGALDSHEGLPGPIYLQGSEAGRVAFRNIVLTPAE
jgi:3-keto-disaccharide hydrolase